MGDYEVFAALAGINEELRRIRISLYVLAKIALPQNEPLGALLNNILEGQFEPHEEPESVIQPGQRD